MLKKMFLLFLAVLLFSCNQDPDGNEDDNQNEGGGSATISGSITLTNSSTWDNLKLGFFPTFFEVSTGTYEDYLEYDDVYDSYNNSYLYYSNNEDNSNVEVTPDAIKDVSSNSGSSSTYSFTFPSNPMLTDDQSFYYRFVVWRDSDSDDKLDLVDLSWFDKAEENAGEYSRLPNKLLGDNSDDLALIHSFHYVDNDTATGYKYNGLGADYMNYINILSDDSTGFNFTVEK